MEVREITHYQFTLQSSEVTQSLSYSSVCIYSTPVLRVNDTQALWKANKRENQLLSP